METIKDVMDWINDNESITSIQCDNRYDLFFGITFNVVFYEIPQNSRYTFQFYRDAVWITNYESRKRIAYIYKNEPLALDLLNLLVKISKPEFVEIGINKLISNIILKSL